MLTAAQGNDELIEHFEADRPVFVARFGFNVTRLGLFVRLGQMPPEAVLRGVQVYDGIYAQDAEQLILYGKEYFAAADRCTLLARLSCYENMENTYLQTAPRPPARTVHSNVLEPFYLMDEAPGKETWTHALGRLGKRILIVSPFVESFRRNLNNAKTACFGPDVKVWHDDQRFVFYKAFNCLVGNRPHRWWKETLVRMQVDIARMMDQFDVALLSCGGYGLPLASWLHERGKSAVYVGGALQLLFGVTGKRWDDSDNPTIRRMLANPGWVRPLPEERIPNQEVVEGACYW